MVLFPTLRAIICSLLLWPCAQAMNEPYVSIEPYQHLRDYHDLYRIFTQNIENLGAWCYDSENFPGSNCVTVARINDEQLAGFVIYGKSHECFDDGCSDSGFINHIAVDRDVRAHGLGTLLLDSAIADLKAQGANDVSLGVYNHNTKAQKLYQKLGFLPHAAHQGQHLLQYTLNLA